MYIPSYVIFYMPDSYLCELLIFVTLICNLLEITSKVKLISQTKLKLDSIAYIPNIRQTTSILKKLVYHYSAIFIFNSYANKSKDIKYCLSRTFAGKFLPVTVSTNRVLVNSSRDCLVE